MSVLRSGLRSMYHQLLPIRLHRAVYRVRHPKEFERLRTAVFPSDKGTFSLRGFDANQAIFVHTPKAAGTAIALSLFGELPYHYTAEDYRAIFGREAFNRYFKFSFVRNPWDRVHSAYTYLLKGGWNSRDQAWSQQHLEPYAGFEAFVLEGLPRREVRQFMHFVPQHHFVCGISGRLLVDYLGYYETIAEDFRRISERLGIGAELVNTNRSTEQDYRERYTLKMRKMVERLYRTDIRKFGYEFGGIKLRRRVGW